MSQRQLDRFRDKVRQLNDFLALADRDPELHRQLVACSTHEGVVAIARAHGFVIDKRWSDPFDEDEAGDASAEGIG